MRGTMSKIITVDGPAGSGKSTVSRLLAKKLGVLYLDTGAMYRAVALQVKREGVDPRDGEGLKELCGRLDIRFEPDAAGSRIYLGEEDISLAIRSPEMDMLSSRISAVQEVREAMTDLQRKVGGRGGLVAEGRDMGTVVFPDADHKFFVTASPEVRANRRYRERLERGEEVSREAVREDLKKRDDQDATRAIAPLRPARDAMKIDTTAMDPARVVEIMLAAVRRKVLSDTGDSSSGAKAQK